ncbi:UDP-glucose 4-epimerase [Paenibacillus sp. PK3_47]|uniref:NAD-dependent epimerase/dehydratase family protein n=1 Tax=Paenibacillus sp. PK3_47 TaxID=2072642 RepID=UPI00201DF4FE|nr:NAD-dependent epimerase/dehydratase family protein [Paenibacillus sp. PK3_47]UQZ33127.1 UDP-glucose 4-epimerase [Paenibacillus sp. PK3_47]
MKILITGQNGYVGNKFAAWLKQWPEDYKVDFISVRDNEWKKRDFSEYDVLFHTAALVHKKEKLELSELYDKVNRDLTVELSKKAKEDKVSQFVFLSSMAVFGVEGSTRREVIIGNSTTEQPSTLYGKSKFKAENEIKEMESENFKVTIIRPPIIYGPDCPGNYSKLKKLVLITPLFPRINNKRSMLYIDNLSDYIRGLIDRGERGTFHPQNKQYVDIQELVNQIASTNHKRIVFSSLLARFISIIPEFKIFNKLFGSLVYDYKLSGDNLVEVEEFENTIKKSN